MANAIKNAGSVDRAAIRDALGKIKGLDTTLGAFSFDENRDPICQSVPLTVKAGKYVLFQ
jgi:branched-chain amino acid transport system substrate-binding protein